MTLSKASLSGIKRQPNSPQVSFQRHQKND
jgi:hypothetical protein